MSPKLSPKKSVEGAAGGIAGSMLLTFLYCFAFQEQIQVEFNEMLIFAVIGGVGALISMVGDFRHKAELWHKRLWDIDSGAWRDFRQI